MIDVDIDFSKSLVETLHYDWISKIVETGRFTEPSFEPILYYIHYTVKSSFDNVSMHLSIESFVEYLVNRKLHFQLLWVLLTDDINQQVHNCAVLDNHQEKFDRSGYTCLMVLARFAEDSDIRILSAAIERGCNLDAKNKHGVTALTLATQSSIEDNNPATVMRLLSLKCNQDSRDKNGTTASVTFSSNMSVAKTVRTLLDAGCDPNIQDKYGCTALIHVVQICENPHHLKHIVSLLLAAGCDPNIRTKHGYTALMLACKCDKGLGVETVKCLLDTGCNIDIQNRAGQTALMLACMHTRSSSIVGLLIDSGCSLNVKDKKGWTALMYACMYTNTGNLATLYGSQMYKEMLSFGNQKSNIETVRLLLDAKCDVDVQNNDGYTALMMASRFSSFTSTTETVRLLIKVRCRVDLVDRNGMTALMLACKESGVDSNAETVKLLLDARSPLFLLDKTGHSALDYAFKCRDPETIRMVHERWLEDFADQSERLKATLFSQYVSAFHIVNRHPSLDISQALTLFEKGIDTRGLEEHLSILCILQRSRVNPHNLELDSWKGCINPIVLSHNYWFTVDELVRFRGDACPYTKVPFNQLSIKYAMYNDIETLKKLALFGGGTLKLDVNLWHRSSMQNSLVEVD